MNPSSHRRILIAGGGMAGISLAWHLCKAQFSGEILIFEKNEQERKERTWSFWQEGEGDWDDIASAEWHQIKLTDFNGKEEVYPIHPFKYLTVNGRDFYDKCLRELTQQPNIQFITGEVAHIRTTDQSVSLQSSGKTYEGDFVFDSMLRPSEIKPSPRAMWQHFYGYTVQFDSDVFDANIPDFMNFNTQVESDCHFIYILPFNSRRALIEYTIFSAEMLKEQDYIRLLERWINTHFGDQHYEILGKEFSAIPMTDAYFDPQPHPRHIKIGTAGGYTNPATGYTFYHTQQRLKALSTQLVKGEWPDNRQSLWQRRFHWYQATLLEVLSSRTLKAHEVFIELFRKNKPTAILQFLNNESSFATDLSIMSSTKIPVFAAAGFKVTIDLMKRL